MADNKNIPEGLDEFLGEDAEGQAAQGWMQLGKMALESQPVQNVITGKGLEDYQAMVNAAMAGDKQAQLALAEHSAMVAGSTKGPNEANPFGKVIVKEELKNPNFGTVTVKELPKQDIGKVRVEEGPLPKPDYGKIIRKPYAEGGEVPEGLDQFLASSPVEGSNTPGMPGLESSSPAGLDDFLSEELKQEKYGTLEQQAKAGLEGLAQGVAGPLAPLAEKALGVKEEDILGRAEANPVTHYGSEAAGLLAPALLTGGASLAGKAGLTGVAKALPQAAKFTQSALLEKGTEKIAEKLGLVAGASLASKVGTAAAKTAIDTMLLAGSDETSKMILNDPTQTAESAIANIGLSGVLGGALGTVSPLWSAAVGSKTAKLVEDFKGRIREHVENPDPVAKMVEELSEYHKNVSELASEVYGPTGLKARDIEKALPKEITPAMAEHAKSVEDSVRKTIEKMSANEYRYPKRLVAQLQGDLDNYTSMIAKENLTSHELFNASQDLKQTLQGYSKFRKPIDKVDEAYDFIKDIKDLSHNVRTSLEDPKIWGKAGTRQQEINKAFSVYKPTLEAFEKKFTTKVVNPETGLHEIAIDPTKIQTYLKQVGSPNAEIKQSTLKNFLDVSEKYKKAIADTHANLGLESPINEASLNVTRASLNEKTAGSKLADAFISKGLTHEGGKGLGAIAGGATGHLLGLHGELGAIIGAYSLGPFFNSVLPGIAKALTSVRASGEGAKAALDFALAAAKHDYTLTKAAKNLFKAGSTVLSSNLYPTEAVRVRLNKQLVELTANNDKLLNSDNKVNHYLPAHASAMDQTTANALNYLNSLKPDLVKKAPLDSKPVASSTQMSKYINALNIAQQPLIVLDKVKNGTITQDDIKALQSMYPRAYLQMQQKIMTELTNHMAKGHMVPYKTRIGLSMFLAQPLDSTMSPASIQSIQGQYVPRQPAQAPTAPKKGSPSSPALQKMPTMYQTPGQARDQHKLK